MPKRKARGLQLDTLPPDRMFESSFNLTAQDEFVTGLGVQFVHYAAMPSPIGLQDRGEYRRSGSVDTISSNGMLYKKVGCFTATLVGNGTGKNFSISATQDDSTARLIMPRFYDKNGEAAEGGVIRPTVGDRLYLADKDADTFVSTYQRMEYNPEQIDRAQFPIYEVDCLVDSRNIEYTHGVDFTIDSDGNIVWSPKNNPGLDPVTGKGRVYSIRYKYRAFWYISRLLNELRITNVTKNDTRTPTRMPYHLQIQREYVYTNQNNGSLPAQVVDTTTERTVSEPTDNIPEIKEIKVNAS